MQDETETGGLWGYAGFRFKGSGLEHIQGPF